MTPQRKQTPDVLAEILGGDLPEIKELPAPVKKTSSPVRRPVEKPAEPRAARWEYSLVSFQDYKGWRPRYINGNEIKNWMNGPLMHVYIGQMGEDGWELAAASAGERLYGNADSHQIYFKRRK